jgi:predicted kinase
MQVEKLEQRLAAIYHSRMPVRSIQHERILILFSGVPGSGKTTLAKNLARDFSAQYIRADDIRTLAHEENIDLNTIVISRVSRKVIDMILENDTNLRIIVDASIDRTWPEALAHARERRIETLIIRMGATRMMVETRRGERHDLDTYYRQFEACKKEVVADIEVEETYEYESIQRQVEALLV